MEHAEDIWVHGMFGTVWADDTLRVASIDFDKKEITTEKPHLYGITGGHFQALNLLEEISQPGEYYVNRETEMLYFWPPADPVGATLGLSMLEEPMVALEGASHVTFEGLTFEITRGIGVYIEGGTGVRVAGCALRNMGVVAVAIGRGIKPFDHLSHEGIGEPASRELQEPTMDFKHADGSRVGVGWVGDFGSSTEDDQYFLRWETLPVNRDRGRRGDLPEPSMLTLYRLVEGTSSE